ncbi:MAG TPA: aminotransferase class V-fold PLP-dependent enzyme [Gaiellaceae bacterium]|nr:aminotransferase class V-fold PLP-dependent enzyme [Gaiellaceae bacterium]
MAELTRRGVLARAGLAAGALALGARPELAEAAPDLRDWGSVRSQFALERGRIHLTSFLLATHPRLVGDAIEAHRQRLDANPVEYLHGPGDGLSAAAREAAARFLGAPASEVALTDSTTMGLGLLYTRLALGPEDEVLTTEHDFYATHEALRLSGARVRRVRLYDDPRHATEDEIVSRVRSAVTGRTRVVALTWVHSATGVRLPLRAIAQALPERVLVCIDGVHGFGARAESVRDLGCDAFVSGCHKWLYGPRGTGVLWANERVRELMRPTIPSFDGSSYGAWVAGGAPSGIPDGPTLTPGGFQTYEHRWALPQAFALHDGIGRERVEARVRGLASRLKAQLDELRGVRLRTPQSPGLSAGLVCFEVAGRDPSRVVAHLSSRRIVASVTPYATRYVRLGPGIVNTPEHVDAAVRAIRTL